MLQNGYTPLHIAAKRNRKEIAAATLKHGAEPNAESVVRAFYSSYLCAFDLASCHIAVYGWYFQSLHFITLV